MSFIHPEEPVHQEQAVAHSQCTQRLSVCECVKGDEGRPCGALLAVHFNKVAVELKNLMHPKKHFPHRGSLDKAVL